MSKYSRNKELIEDVNAVFTLTALDTTRGFELAEKICMNSSPMAQVFWGTMFHNALNANLENIYDA